MLRISLGVVAALCLGLGWAGIQTARADHAYEAAQDRIQTGQGDGLALLREAVGLRPDWAAPAQLLARQLAFAEPQEARSMAYRALRLDPRSWESWDTLALLEFQLGNVGASWQALQNGLRVNHGFAAHFQAANLALALDRAPLFWSQMRSALAMAPAAQLPYALNAAMAAGPGEPDQIAAILPSDPDLRARAVAYLAQRGAIEAATQGWEGMATCPEYTAPVCGVATVTIADALLQSLAQAPAAKAGEDVGRAVALWNHAVGQGWLPGQQEVAAGHNLDPEFRSPWLGQAFSWRSASPVLNHVLASPRSGEGNQVVFQLDGSEPEQARLLRQFVAVAPDAGYEVVCRAERLGAGTQAGLELQVTAGAQVLLQAPLALGSGPTTTRLRFHTASGTALVDVQLLYQRQSGDTLMRTPVGVSQLEVRPVPAGARP